MKVRWFGNLLCLLPLTALFSTTGAQAFSRTSSLDLCAAKVIDSGGTMLHPNRIGSPPIELSSKVFCQYYPFEFFGYRLDRNSKTILLINSLTVDLLSGRASHPGYIVLRLGILNTCPNMYEVPFQEAKFCSTRAINRLDSKKYTQVRPLSAEVEAHPIAEARKKSDTESPQRMAIDVSRTIGSAARKDTSLSNRDLEIPGNSVAVLTFAFDARVTKYSRKGVFVFRLHGKSEADYIELAIELKEIWSVSATEERGK